MAYKRYFESIDVSSNDSFVKELLGIQDQVKVFHWQTSSYATHKALGDYYDSLSDLIDKFVEEYQGQFGRVPIKPNPMKSDLIGLGDLQSEEQIVMFVKNVWQWLTTLRQNTEKVEHTTNLQNIIDEMIGETSKLKYLLTLN